MTYFLDFDRTIFNTEVFLPYLADLPALSKFKVAIHMVLVKGRGRGLSSDAEREELWKTINEMYQEGKFTFGEGELERFVFPDALDFLKKHSNESVVVTSAGVDPYFQEGKLKSSGVSAMVAESVFVVVGGLKGPVVEGLLSKYPGPYVFIDDLIPQIDSVAESCPQVAAYEMRRDTGESSGRYHVLRSFSELPKA